MTTSVQIDDDLKNRIQHLAVARRRTPHWIMRQAIRDYIVREEAKEHFRQEAVSSWKSYQETGRHLTGQEVRSRLNTCGTEKDLGIPPCHE